MKSVLYLLVLLFTSPLLHAEQIVRIAAASSLQFTLAEIALAFKLHTGHTVKITYGSSGNFRRQIMQGAPFEVFLSADESYIDALYKEGYVTNQGQVYALGRIALLLPRQGGLQGLVDLTGLKSAIERGELTYFAIANPEHAPYGRAAREALESVQLWKQVQPFLALGENASQAAQFAISGSSQGGIVPYSLAMSPRIAKKSHSILISSSQHQPIRQRMVLLKNSGDIARQFYKFLGDSKAIEILTRYGYGIPEHD